MDTTTLPADAEELVIHAPMLKVFGPFLPCAPRLRSLVLETLSLEQLHLPALPELRHLDLRSHHLAALPARLQ